VIAVDSFKAKFSLKAGQRAKRCVASAVVRFSHFTASLVATGRSQSFYLKMDNPYLPLMPAPLEQADPDSVPSESLLAFVDSSNHRTAKLSMIVSAVILPCLFLLSCLILLSRDYVFGTIMATSVLVAGVGWLRALRYFLAPFTFHAAFYLDGLRLWRSDNPDSVAFYSRTEIDRFLIEPNVVTFSIQSSWIEKGFVGIYWNEPRIQELERFLAQYWPETHVRRTKG